MSGDSPVPAPRPVGLAALVGGGSAVLLSPVAAALVAIVYRFPVPFAGYASGLGGAATAALGSLFYLVLGGVLVLAVLGVLGGVLAARIGSPHRTRVLLTAIGLGFAAALVAAVCLALLEYVIGPW